MSEEKRIEDRILKTEEGITNIFKHLNSMTAEICNLTYFVKSQSEAFKQNNNFIQNMKKQLDESKQINNYNDIDESKLYEARNYIRIEIGDLISSLEGYEDNIQIDEFKNVMKTLKEFHNILSKHLRKYPIYE